MALLVAATLVLAAWITDPTWRDPQGVLLCNVVHPDCAGNYWLLHWVPDQLASLRGLGHNDRYYWPFGDSPYLAGNGGEGFLVLPFHLLLPWPSAPNLFLVLLLAANGLAAAWAARAAGASWPGVFLAAGVTTCGMVPLRELSSGRFSQADCAFLFAFLASWLRFLEAPRLGRALLAATLLAITSVLYWYYGLFGALAGAVLLAGRRLEGPLAWRSLGIFVLTFLGAVALPLAWFLARWSDLPGTEETVFPHPEAVRDSLDPAWPFLIQGGRFVTQALPGLVVVLAGLQVLRLLWPRFRPRRWAVDLALLGTWVLFFALAMGPRLSVGGVSPYSLIYGLLPPLQRFWWPSRHVLVSSFALTLLAARCVPPPRRGPSLLLGLALLVSAPASLAWQGVSPRILTTRLLEWPPAFYEKVGALPGTVALELPLSPRVAISEKLLLFQLVHGKTLLTGHALWLDRVRPQGWDAMVAANSFLRALGQVDEAALLETFRFDEEDLLSLRAQGLGSIVLNAETYPLSLQGAVRQQKQVLRVLFGPPAAEAMRAWAWRTDRWTGITEVPVTAWTWPDTWREATNGVPDVLRAPSSRIFDPPGEPWSVVPPSARPPTQAPAPPP